MVVLALFAETDHKLDLDWRKYRHEDSIKRQSLAVMGASFNVRLSFSKKKEEKAEKIPRDGGLLTYFFFLSPKILTLFV